MANRSHGRGRQVRAVPAQPPLTAPVIREPPVRRWPHPVDDEPPAPMGDPALYYIRCALSYQNQQLADIKALLQQLAARDGGE